MVAYIIINSKIEDGEHCGCSIDSVWSSERKAQKKDVMH